MSNLFDPSKNASISKQEEADLFREFHDPQTSEKRKKEIRDKIITSNTGFVLKTAQYYAAKSPTFYEDFVSAGFEGLLVAFEKYKPETGYRFLTYAGFWIRERVLKTMSTFRIVMVPSINQQIQSKLERLRNQGVSETEILNHFKEEQHSLVLRMMQNPYLTYSLEDLTEEVSEPEVDLLSPDYHLVSELVKELPSRLQEEVSLFLSGQPYDEDLMEEALSYLRERIGCELP